MTAFSYQLYSSRNFPPLKDTLTMLSGLGYSQVEGYGGLYANPDLVDELVANLGASGLTMPTAHIGLPMLEDEPDRVLEICKAVGIETIYCPHIAAPDRPDTGAGWEAFGKRLQAASAPYRAAGLGFGWHNHDFEFRATDDGVIPQVAIFAGGPDLEWEADIAWVAKSGQNPLEWIETFAERLTAIHVKDIAPAGENADEDGWADVGHGTLDWPALMAAARKAGAKYFVMEHDNPNDHTRFASRAIASARAL